MSAVDCMFERRMKVAFSARPVRRRGFFVYVSTDDGKTKQLVVRYPWWWSRFADLAERRARSSKTIVVKGVERSVPEPRQKPEPRPAAEAAPAPEMLARPEGMTRQTHRRLYREACKLAGVSHRAS